MPMMPEYSIVITKPLPKEEAERLAAQTGGTIVDIKFHPTYSLPEVMPFEGWDGVKVNPPLVPTNLNALAVQCHRVALEKGWYEPQAKSFGEVTALFHSELSEALEEHRNGRGYNEIYYRHDKKCLTYPHEEIWEKGQLTDCCDLKPEGIPIEWADTIIRMGDSAGYWGIDLDYAVAIKTQYNMTREIRHGGKKL